MISSIDKKFVCKDSVSEFLEGKIRESKIPFISVADSSFHPSRITQCPRRIIYRSRGEKGVLKESRFILAKQDHLKFKWISLLDNLDNSIRVLHKNVDASDCNYNLHDKVDAIININGDIFAIKAIYVRKEEFNEILSRGALKKHVVEMIVDIWLLEVDGGCLIYESDDNINVFHIKPYRPIIESVVKKCEMLCDYKIKGLIPNRPYKSVSKECSVCEYEALCWDKNNKE